MITNVSVYRSFVYTRCGTGGKFSKPEGNIRLGSLTVLLYSTRLVDWDKNRILQKSCVDLLPTAGWDQCFDGAATPERSVSGFFPSSQFKSHCTGVQKDVEYSVVPPCSEPWELHHASVRAIRPPFTIRPIQAPPARRTQGFPASSTSVKHRPAPAKTRRLF